MSVRKTQYASWAVCLALASSVAGTSRAADQGASSASGVARPLKCDPASVMGPDACVKCHQAEVQHWQTTPHCQTFEELHRSSEAKAIADRLDPPLPDATNEVVCPCPDCGMADADRLVWQDDEFVRCDACGTIYAPDA